MPTRRNIALIGFMTAGKTHVGRFLATLTSRPFRDLDLLIAEQERRSIPVIFEELGEPRFREVESEVLKELCRRDGQIISCGGGTILSETNRELLAANCETVWLRVSEAEVMSRLAKQRLSQRPLLAGSNRQEIVRRLLGEREPFYSEADHCVETDGRSAKGVAQEIAARLGLLTLEDGGSGVVGEM